MSILLKTVLGLMTTIFGYFYFVDIFRNCRFFTAKRWSGLLGTGFITNFFDTLGIGSFAPQTAIFKFFRLVDDRLIPGTMNIGNTIPTVLQAFIFMTVVEVDPKTLVSISTAAPLGAFLGAGMVAGMSRRRIQTGLGFGLMAVGLLMIAGYLNWMPVGGGRHRTDWLETGCCSGNEFYFWGPCKPLESDSMPRAWQWSMPLACIRSLPSLS